MIAQHATPRNVSGRMPGTELRCSSVLRLFVKELVLRPPRFQFPCKKLVLIRRSELKTLSSAKRAEFRIGERSFDVTRFRAASLKDMI